jgi:hypothetical protein
MLDGTTDSPAEMALPDSAPVQTPDVGEVDIAAKSAEIAAAADADTSKPADDVDLEAKPEEAKPEGEEEPKVEEEAAPAEPPELVEAKTQLVELEAKVGELTQRDNDWRESALETLASNRALADRVSLLEAYLEQNGIAVDERDEQILELKAQGYQTSIKEQAQKAGATKQQEAQIVARATELRIDAENIAKRDGLPMDLLMQRWGVMSDKAGRTVAFDDAAKSLKDDFARANTSRQVEAQKALKQPLPAKGQGSSTRVNLASPLTEEGIRQRLEAAGHKID